MRNYHINVPGPWLVASLLALGAAVAACLGQTDAAVTLGIFMLCSLLFSQ